MDAIWGPLGIKPTADATLIRRAYARALKATHPEDDAGGFQALRRAYEMAMARAGSGQRPKPPRQPPAPTAPRAEPRQTAVQTGAPEADPGAPDLAGELALAARAHQRACQTLERQVRAGATPDDELLATLEAVLASPGMDHVSTYERTEQWLAQLVHQAAPNADPLVNRLIEHFRWNIMPPVGGMSFGGPALRRREELGVLNELQRRSHPLHAGLLQLQNVSPPGLWRDRSNADIDRLVRAVLELRVTNSAVARVLNPEAVAWWETRLSQPHLQPLRPWRTFLIPLGLSPFAAVAVSPLLEAVWPHFPAWAPIVVGYLVCQLAVAPVLLLWLHAVAWPRHAWRLRPKATRPAWLEYGWVPAAIVPILLVAAIPANGWSFAVAACLSAVATYWAAITGDFDRREGLRFRWRVRAATGFGYLAIFYLGVLRYLQGDALALLVTTAAGAVCFTAGSGSLIQAWPSLARTVRLGCLATLGAATVLAGAVAILADGNQALALLAAGLVISVLLSHQAPAAHLGEKAAQARAIIMLGGWFAWAVVLTVVGAKGEPTGSLLMYALWMLSGVAFSVVAQAATLLRKPPVAKPARP